MTNLGILDWLNENERGQHPLSQPLRIRGVLVDAAFVQFDGFVPRLKQLEIRPGLLVITLLLDSGLESFELRQEDHLYGGSLRLFVEARYVGVLVFGDGVLELFRSRLNQVLRYDIPFTASTVTPIPRASGVYSLAGLFGAVTLVADPEAPVSVLFATAGQEIQFSSVSLGGQALTGTPLKTINTKVPVNNQLRFESSDVIKVDPDPLGLLISVAGGAGNLNIGPTRRYG